MTTKEFVSTRAWAHRREEVRFEIAAVCSPVLLYLVVGVVSFFADRPVDWHHIMGVPDALFGGCILCALTTIHSWRFDWPIQFEASKVVKSIKLWRWGGLIGFFVCLAVSVLAILYHPVWALIVGLLSIYFGSRGYKSVVFCKSYLSLFSKIASELVLSDDDN